MSAMEPLRVDIVSDVVCPWCFVGKRRLEKAIAQAGVPLDIHWRPFQLDPTIPPGGKSRRDYLTAKFGTEARIRELHDNLSAVGEAEDISFAFDRIERSPNTLDAHRLVRWAEEAGKQGEIVEELFSGYFLEGRDIGDHAVLADIAAAHSMDRESILARLASDEDRDIVRAEIVEAQQMGVSGVPTFILIGKYALVGAQPPETIAHALQTIASNREELSADA